MRTRCRGGSGSSARRRLGHSPGRQASRMARASGMAAVTPLTFAEVPLPAQSQQPTARGRPRARVHGPRARRLRRTEEGAYSRHLERISHPRESAKGSRSLKIQQPYFHRAMKVFVPSPMDLTDEQWEAIKRFVPGPERGDDTRLFAVLHRLHSASCSLARPCRLLDPELWRGAPVPDCVDNGDLRLMWLKCARAVRLHDLSEVLDRREARWTDSNQAR